MANERQCIILNTLHNVTHFTIKHSSYKNATTGYLDRKYFIMMRICLEMRSEFGLCLGSRTVLQMGSLSLNSIFFIFKCGIYVNTRPWAHGLHSCMCDSLLSCLLLRKPMNDNQRRVLRFHIIKQHIQVTMQIRRTCLFT